MVIDYYSFMIKEIKLEAQIRTKEKGKPEKVKSHDFIPAVLYGPSAKNQNLKIKKIDLERAFALAGESNLIDLMIDDNPPIKVLVKEVQKNPLKDTLIHVDLYQVDMNKKITTAIPLHFIGESPAVKELGAILIKNIDSLEIECLPGNLISYIEVDLSILKNFHDVIKVNDLKIPPTIKLVNETNDVVANVVEPRVEVEEVPTEETPAREEGAEKEAGEKEPAPAAPGKEKGEKK